MLGAVLPIVAESQTNVPPAFLDPVNRTVWSDSELGIRFTYPPVWVPATATQQATRVVINWRLSKSKTLLATCVLETSGATQSEIAKLQANQIHAKFDDIKASLLANFRLRALDGRLLNAQKSFVDGQPVIFVVREGSIQNLDRVLKIKAYSVTTSWRGHEINFECSTPIFGEDYSTLVAGSKLVADVEAAVIHVLRTLQFDRVTK